MTVSLLKIARTVEIDKNMQEKYKNRVGKQCLNMLGNWLARIAAGMFDPLYGGDNPAPHSKPCANNT